MAENVEKEKTVTKEETKKEVKNETKEQPKNKLVLFIKIILFALLCIPTAMLYLKVSEAEKLNKKLWAEIESKYFELGFDKEALLAKQGNPEKKVEREPTPNVLPENNRFRKFRQDEMSKYFTVDLIHEIEPENYFMKRALKEYDINDDEKMKEHPEEYKVNSVMYGKYLEKGFKDDDRFYIQFIDQNKGFGLFAFKEIKQNDVIGVYTGLITMKLGKKMFDTRYLFHITSIKHPHTGAKADLYIDARAAGNQLRFVNHDSNPNCEAIYVPYKNMWNVIFVAKRDIAINEEITISYGKSYKSVRGKELEVKVEESGPDDYMDTEWDKKRKEEKEARDPNTGKLLHPHMPNKYELEEQRRKIIERMKRSRDL